jgi:hypothetical protein
VNIKILYFDECPNRGPTLELVKEALRQEGLTAELVEVNVRDEATAQSVRFLGSPTIQVDGMDVEATARSSQDFGMMCRTYGDSGKRVGIPPIDLIRAALRETAGGKPGVHDAARSDKCGAGIGPHAANGSGISSECPPGGSSPFALNWALPLFDSIRPDNSY